MGRRWWSCGTYCESQSMSGEKQGRQFGNIQIQISVYKREVGLLGGTAAPLVRIRGRGHSGPLEGRRPRLTWFARRRMCMREGRKTTAGEEGRQDRIYIPETTSWDAQAGACCCCNSGRSELGQAWPHNSAPFLWRRRETKRKPIFYSFSVIL